jgi:hypothetical protein
MSDDCVPTVQPEAPVDRSPKASSHARNLGVALTVCGAGLAVFLAVVGIPEPQGEGSAVANSIEADMLVSRGNAVELYLNDWEHPPERVPVVAGQRHIYRFTNLPRDITLVRLDPADVPDARMVIYRLTVKAGNQTFQTFRPAELKNWHLQNLSAPKEENGGMVMLGTTDDPILWTPLTQTIRLPEPPKPSTSAPLYSRLHRYHRPLLLTLAALLLMTLLRTVTGISVMEVFMAALAVELALWIVLTTAYLSYLAWVPVPVGDDWDRWITYRDAPDMLTWYFQQHADHRIPTAKLLLEFDHFAFHARGWFPILGNFCFQALTGIMLWRLSQHVCRQDRGERWILASVIAACLFSGQQWINFTRPFQIVFPLLYCAATAAFLCLWKGAQHDWRGGATWVAACIAAATIATYTMANGILLWPVLLLAAYWLRIPRRWMAALTIVAMLLGVAYFYHWRRMMPPLVELPAAQRWSRVAIFLLANLGSPLTPLAFRFNADNVRLAVAAIPGGLLAVALLTGFVGLWRRRGHYNSARAILIFYGVFLAGSSASMAYGRSYGTLLEAFTPRYLTPSYIFWVCMLLAAWPLLRQFHRATLYAALCAAMYVGIAMHQQNLVNGIRYWLPTVPRGEAAVVDNVTDVTGWTPLYHTPRITGKAVDYMRDHHLSIFEEEWTHWPGIPLHQRFSIDPTPDACQGQFEAPIGVPATLKPGWLATGWAWDVKAGQSPRYLILADNQGQVAGVALTDSPRQPAPSAGHPGSPWNGYVNGLPRLITAYVVEADDRSLCAIGTQSLPPLVDPQGK